MYITTQESKLTSQSFAAILAEANLGSKNNIANFVKKRTHFHGKLKNLNKNISSNKIKQVPVQNELNEL